MAGQGKYTIYAPPATDRNNLLNKLFKGNSKESNPFADLTGKENDAEAYILAIAKQYLTPSHQDGDKGMFPNGVNLDYSGDKNDITAPNQEDVKWTSAGDPANGYVPDLRSPGPGQTDAQTADNLQTDPKISPADIAGPGYVPGAPDTGTVSPSKTASKIVTDNELGTVQTKGDSGANS